MATVTQLGFNLTSKWDGSGVRDARNDLAQLYTELQAIERNRVHITAEANTAAAIKQLNEAAKQREAKIDANANTATAEAKLDFAARDRTTRIHLDTDRNIRALNFLSQAFMRTGIAANEAGIMSQKGLTFGQLAAVGFVGAINLIGPAVSIASSAIATLLPMGITAAAIAILKENERIKEGWESLTKEGGEIFKRAAEPMVQPLVQAMNLIKQGLRDLEPEFKRVFENNAPLVEPMARGFWNFAKTVLPGVADGLAGMVPLMESFARSGEMAGTRLGNMFRAMGDNAVGLGKVWEATLNGLFQFIETIGVRGAEMANSSAVLIEGIMGGLNALFDGFLVGVKGMMDNGGEAMATTWLALGESIGKVFEILLPPLGELIGAISISLVPLIIIAAESTAHFMQILIEGLTPAFEKAAPVVVALADGYDRMHRVLDPLIGIVGTVAVALAGLGVALRMLHALSPVVQVLKAIKYALVALMAHPVIALAILAGGIVYLATQTTVLQDTWNKFAPGWAKKPFEEGADGTSQFSRGMDRLKESFSNAWDTIKEWGGHLKNLFSGDAANTVTEFTTAIRNAFEDVKKALGGLIEPLKGLWTELQPVFKVIGGALVMLGQVGWEVFNGMLGPAIQIFGDVLAAVIKAIGGIINIISGVIRTIKGFVEVIVGIFQVVYGFFTGNEDVFMKGWEKISQGLEDIIQGIGNIFRGLLQIVRSIWDAIYGVFRNAGEMVWNIVWGFVKGVVDFFTWLWDILVGHSIVPDMINAIIQWFKELPGKVWEIVKGFVSGVINFFIELAQKVISTIVDFIQGLWDRFTNGLGQIRDFWVGVWNGIRDFAVGLWNWIRDRFNDFVEGWKIILNTGLEWIKNIWNLAWGWIRDTAQGIWNWIRDRFNDWVEGWKLILNTGLEWIKNIWNLAWGWIRDFAVGLWNWVREQFNLWVEAWKMILNNGLEWIKGIWNFAWSFIRDFAVGLWNWVREQFNLWVEAWKTILNNGLEWIKNIWNVAWGWIRDTAIGIWNWIRDRWNEFTEAIKNTLQGAIDWVRDKWNDIWSWVRDKAVEVWNDIKQKFIDFKDGVVGTIEGLVQKVKDVWDRIVGIFDGPVRAVKGIWNGVAGAFGLPKFADGGEVERRADGGAIFGPGGPRDDKIPAYLSNGEHVLTAAEVDAAGGHSAIYQFRKGLVQRRGNIAQDNRFSQSQSGAEFAYGGAAAYADGGAAARLNQATQMAREKGDGRAYVYGGSGPNGFDCSGYMSAIYRVLTGASNWWSRAFSTESDFNGLGFANGLGPGFSIGVHRGGGGPNSHMAGTLDGVNVESGGGHNSTRFGGPAQGADSGNFSLRWHLPIGADGQFVSGGAGGGSVGPSAEQIAAHRRAIDEIKAVVNRTNAETASKQWGMTVHEMNRAAVGDFIGPVSAVELNKAAQNMFGMYAPAGDTHGAGTHDVGAGAIGKLDAALAAASAAIGGMIPEGERRAIIEKALQITNTPPPSTLDAWLAGMNTLITRESNWNAGAINTYDSNAAAGNASRGLAQVIPTTFNAHKVPGYDNINAPVDNVAASINYIKSRYGTIENVQQANANMPPKGYYEGTNSAAGGWAVVGEKGPEAVRFRGGEQVKSFDDIIKELKQRASGHAQELTTKLEAEVTKAIEQASVDARMSSEELISKLESEISSAIDRAMGEAHAANSDVANRVAAEVRGGIEHLASLVGIQISIPTNIGDGVNDGREIIDTFKNQVVPQLEMALRQQIGRRA